MRVSTKSISKKAIACVCWINALVSVGLLTPVVAQNSECFMLDADGAPMDLGHLCGNANRSTLRTNFDSGSKSDLIIIPIKRRVGGTPVVDVTFENGHTYEMLFDTGASMTVISESMAKEIGVKATGKLPFQTASSRMVFFGTGTMKTTKVGNLTKNNVNIAIAPTLDMGLLGQNLYGMYDITIKYGTIELKRR